MVDGVGEDGDRSGGGATLALAPVTSSSASDGPEEATSAPGGRADAPAEPAPNAATARWLSTQRRRRPCPPAPSSASSPGTVRCVSSCGIDPTQPTPPRPYRPRSSSWQVPRPRATRRPHRRRLHRAIGDPSAQERTAADVAPRADRSPTPKRTSGAVRPDLDRAAPRSTHISRLVRQVRAPGLDLPTSPAR